MTNLLLSRVVAKRMARTETLFMSVVRTPIFPKFREFLIRDKGKPWNRTPRLRPRPKAIFIASLADWGQPDVTITLPVTGYYAVTVNDVKPFFHKNRNFFWRLDEVAE